MSKTLNTRALIWAQEGVDYGNNENGVVASGDGDGDDDPPPPCS